MLKVTQSQIIRQVHGFSSVALNHMLICLYDEFCLYDQSDLSVNVLFLFCSSLLQQ